MTWGSNATFDAISCRYCDGPAIDDADEGLSSHEKTCDRRPANLLLDIAGLRHPSEGGAPEKPVLTARDLRTIQVFRAVMGFFLLAGVVALSFSV